MAERYFQIESINVSKTFSLVAWYVSSRLNFAVAEKLSLMQKVIDLKIAYTNAESREKLYACQAEVFETENSGISA